MGNDEQTRCVNEGVVCYDANSSDRPVRIEDLFATQVKSRKRDSDDFVTSCYMIPYVDCHVYKFLAVNSDLLIYKHTDL